MRDLEIAVSTTNRELESLNKDLLKKINDLENQINRHRDYQQIKDENSALNLQRNDLTKKLNQAAIDYQQIKDEKAELEALSAELRMNLETLENQLKNQNESLSSQLKKFESDLQAANEKAQTSELKDSEILSLENYIQELSSKVEALTEDKTRLEKEIESSRSIIKDLNKDFDVHQKKIESLIEEKAALVAELESKNLKITSDTELNASKENEKPSERYDALTNENYKLQESNRELVKKLENLEKSSERKVSDQEIEELVDNTKHYVHINAELNELKKKYDELKVEEIGSTEIDGKESSGEYKLNAIKTERDALSNRLKKIMTEVEDVSNKNLFLEQKVENYLILEQSNERLKLMNEKLSRQLDETLACLKLIELH